ncbi:MAG: RagB/SusD family nutrient uptake outer membrane protein [Paludibacter sp.]|nr:RagB/SusD family nutrient uptake outer membrane protein [Paludibacter sp.]
MAIFVLILFSNACEFLDQVPYSTSSPENSYKNENDFKITLAGCYEVINAMYISDGSNIAGGTYSQGLQYFFEGCSDNVIGSTASATLMSLLRADYNPESQDVNSFWKAFFTGISRCNYMIDRIPKGELTVEQQVQFMAEARFLRAFYYNHLASMFGGLPYCVEPAIDPRLPRENLEKIYSLIISDLEYAYRNHSEDKILKCSIDKWGAGAYLGMVYNYLASCKRYDVGHTLLDRCPLNSFAWVDANATSMAAKTVLEDVVKNSPYILVGASDYKRLFYEMSKNTQYKECLFMSEWSSKNPSKGRTVYTVLAPAGGVAYRGTWQRMFPTMRLYKSYTEGDIRRDMFITGMYSTSPAPEPETVDGYTYYIPRPSSGTSDNSSYQLFSTGKFRISALGSGSVFVQGQCAMNDPLIRLADVILHYAEALYFTGNEQLAREQFIPIRDRIRGVLSIDDITTQYRRDDFVDELLEERGRELCFEAKRRVDLMRFGKMTNAIMTLPEEGTLNLRLGIQMLKDNWSEYKIWYPVPQIQIEVNASFVQNAGYAD